MSLRSVPFYTVLPDGTIQTAGWVQAIHLADVQLQPSEKVRMGIAHPLQHYEDAQGNLVEYTQAQKDLRANPPGRGWVWRVNGWLDHRTLAMVKEDKIAALQSGNLVAPNQLALIIQAVNNATTIAAVNAI